MTDVAARRLAAQRLTGPPYASPLEAVRRLGAIQAQDYAGAKWALSLRTGASEAELDRLFDAGALLRTHVLRPTWHFVLPEDVRWLLDLSGPRLLRWVAPRHRQLELDPETILRAENAFAAALEGGRELTRAELGEVLTAAGIRPDGQRLPHLLLAAEARGLLVSGARRGAQQTWALLEERVPPGPRLAREEAVAQLALRYFRDRGPARLDDFAWWSGLTKKDAGAGVAATAAELREETLDGAAHWAAREAPDPSTEPPAHLLPNFDEYLVAYRERSAALHPDRPLDSSLFAFGSILSNVVLLHGKVAGGWRRTLKGGSVHVELRLQHPLRPPEAEALRGAAERYAVFLGRQLTFEAL